MRVSVDALAGVEVVLPRRSPERAAAEAVVELRPWIERRMAEARAVREHVAARAGTVPYLGTDLSWRPEPGARACTARGPSCSSRPATPTPRWSAGTGAPRARRSYRGWISRSPRCAELLELTIRNQRTRWGSCSTMGAMSFNWRLLLAPEPVLDYVVWHEACHLRVMDHSSRFWDLLGDHCPGYSEPRRWLRRHGATLVL